MCIRDSTTDEVYGLELSEAGELVMDKKNFFTTNMMKKMCIRDSGSPDRLRCFSGKLYPDAVRTDHQDHRGVQNGE